MSRAKEADFYYGSVLSALFNNKNGSITPAIVEGNDRRIYNFITDNTEFKLFIKYRSDKQNTKKNEYSSWLFTLTDDNIKELCQYLKEGCNLIVALVCGVKSLKKSQIALLDKDQIQEIIDLNKTSITISRKNHEKKFRISEYQ
ncbi:hypothetical protein [Clostridium kluyveri]|uniref:Uncharacterized protein n=2 Tax=Clostridium kluyveri TaxID=1534 RepID=A5N0C9_CLOK5|nr:hypothetical protein [Clostridium kluyveri]EDK34575.1 Conserved hypothetical protein [Clostridium kluyveri DSM 555]BAH07322.1 hypothetical protein CKR_2271 [Clostridium kluyveri NBRC 12016]